jgi:hypothetical protein
LTVNGFSQEELLTYQMTVYRNMVDLVQAIVLATRKVGIGCETPSNRVSNLFLLDYVIIVVGSRNVFLCDTGHYILCLALAF